MWCPCVLTPAPPCCMPVEHGLWNSGACLAGHMPQLRMHSAVTLKEPKPLMVSVVPHWWSFKTVLQLQFRSPPRLWQNELMGSMSSHGSAGLLPNISPIFPQYFRTAPSVCATFSILYGIYVEEDTCAVKLTYINVNVGGIRHIGDTVTVLGRRGAFLFDTRYRTRHQAPCPTQTRTRKHARKHMHTRVYTHARARTNTHMHIRSSTHAYTVEHKQRNKPNTC